MEITKNTVVVSLKGHDTGRRYVVTNVVSPEFVLLADGKYRKLDNPKLKRMKHVKVIGATDALEKGVPQDAELVKALKTISTK